MGSQSTKQPMRRARKVLLGLTVVVAVTALVVGGWVISLQHRTYDVVAVLGQSNAMGYGKGWDPLGEDAPNLRVQQLATYDKLNGVVLPGLDPLLHPGVALGEIGFGPTFAEEYAKATGREVLLVPVGVGVTGFTPTNGYTWDPGDTSAENLFDTSVAQIREALDKNPDSRLAAVLWQQGENDTAMSEPEYRAHLESLIDGLRAEFGEAPFLIGGMSPDWQADQPGTVEAAQRAITRDMPATAYIPGPSGMTNPRDVIHYNAEGQRELGRRYWEAFSQLSTR